MNQPSSTPVTPTCAALAPLLPLLALNRLDGALGSERAAEARVHLAECSHCQREVALHARIDTALRQAFAVRADAAPPLAREQLAALLASDPPAVEERPATTPGRTLRRSRFSVGAGLPAAAAVLLIALFAGYLFRTGGRGILTAPTPTAAVFHVPAGTRLTSIAPVSTTEWWAAGSLWNPAYSSSGSVAQVTPGTTYVDPIIVHGVDGRLSLAPLPSTLLERTYGVQLAGIAMDSATDGWAIGNTVLPPNADGWTASVLLHFTGGTWTVAKAPVDGYLNAIAMRTPSDGWIAGLDNSGNTLVLHYDGATWTQVRDPALTKIYVHSIATPAPDDVWMVGYHLDDGSGNSYLPNGTLVLAFPTIVHFEGTHWTDQSGPSPNTQVASIAMVAPNEGWAIADAPAEQYPGADSAADVAAAEYILAFHDGVWQQQATFTHAPHGPFFTLIGLAMRSAGDGWAVGSRGTLIHYSGGRWHQVPGPTTRDLNAVILSGAGGGWAVGDGVILHLVSDQWTVAAVVGAAG